MGVVRIPVYARHIRSCVDASLVRSKKMGGIPEHNSVASCSLDVDGSTRFPGSATYVQFSGLVRFLRDSVDFAVEQKKASLTGKSLISLNAEVRLAYLAKALKFAFCGIFGSAIHNYEVLIGVKSNGKKLFELEN